MSELLASLAARLRELPSSLRAGLRPGVRADASAAQRLRRNFVFHLHPLKVTARALSPATTLGLGVISLTLFGILLLTGLLLMLYYVPSPRQAYASMLDIEHVVTLGHVTRLAHRWAGHAMVVVVALHVLRVVGMAAYRRRELNWWIGLCMLALLLLLAFTGYLLPWDQTSYWAVRVVANMLDHLPLLGGVLGRLLLGGNEVGEGTLVRFYALHVALLPFPLLVLAALHLWRIRRDGGLARVAAPGESTVPAWPHLVLREAVLGLAVVAVVMLLALTIDASLGPPADVMRPSNPEKAPWYFLGLQEMVSYSAAVGGVAFPLGLLGLLVLLPYLDRGDDAVGRWLGRGAERRSLAVAALAAAALGSAIVVSFMHPWAVAQMAGWPPWAQDVANPGSAALLLAVLMFALVGRRLQALRPALRAALSVLVIMLVLFTLVGLSRGPDWAFYWPWQEWPRAR